ncbi:MAG: hypothetical protein HY560_12615, partial [Gemmatimonadetes bacterium]|nr:hypothetical protein [Gemmatimonadota bacterium]
DAQRVTGAVQQVRSQLVELETTAANAQAAQSKVREVQDSLRELTARLETLKPTTLTRELDERAAQMAETHKRIVRLEKKLADWDTLEQNADRAIALARERRGAVDALQGDLKRLFEVADTTVKQVRAAVELQQSIDQRRQALDPVLAKLRNLDDLGASLEERAKRLAEAEERLSRLDAMLIDLETTFETVQAHKEFLERVVETAGNLSLQTMHAEAVINTLREAGEEAKTRRPRPSTAG